MEKGVKVCLIDLPVTLTRLNSHYGVNGQGQRIRRGLTHALLLSPEKENLSMYSKPMNGEISNHQNMVQMSHTHRNCCQLKPLWGKCSFLKRLLPWEIGRIVGRERISLLFPCFSSTFKWMVPCLSAVILSAYFETHIWVNQERENEGMASYFYIPPVIPRAFQKNQLFLKELNRRFRTC